RRGRALQPPHARESGPPPSHTATFLRALGPEPWKAAYVQPSRRPKDGRYGENPNRPQPHYHYQVGLKPPARRTPGPLPRVPRGARLRPEDRRRALRRGRLGEPDARCLGTRLGGLAER